MDPRELSDQSFEIIALPISPPFSSKENISSNFPFGFKVPILFQNFSLGIVSYIILRRNIRSKEVLGHSIFENDLECYSSFLHLFYEN
jgi:hypothetical protein